jgi:hypothetical protein
MSKIPFLASYGLIEKYRDEFGSRNRAIDPIQTEHLRAWLESKGVVLDDKPLIIQNGSGGGQNCCIKYHIYDINGNAGRKCIFYIQSEKITKELSDEGHRALESYLSNDIVDEWREEALRRLS